MQLLRSGFDLRHEVIARSRLVVFFGPKNVTSRHWDCCRIWPVGANNVHFSPVLGNVSHSRKWRMIYGQLEGIGRRWNWPSCMSSKINIQIYKNLCLVISPSRAPPSQIYLWNTFRRPANALAFFVTTPYLRLYVAFTVCIQDQTYN